MPHRLRWTFADHTPAALNRPVDVLLWSIGRCKTNATRVHDTLVEIPRAPERLADSPIRGQWATLLDEAQVIACILIGHAGRERDLAPLAREFTGSPWVLPIRDTPNAGTLARAQDLLAPYWPPWPSGQWYAPCREQAGDDCRRSGRVRRRGSRGAG